jgi:hypothetical protein
MNPNDEYTLIGVLIRRDQVPAFSAGPMLDGALYVREDIAAEALLDGKEAALLGSNMGMAFHRAVVRRRDADKP